MGISPTLNIPQARFLAMQHKFIRKHGQQAFLKLPK